MAKVSVAMPVQKNVPTKITTFLREQALPHQAIERIILFGSRARGNSTEKSDFDVAVEAPQWSHAEWARWADRVRNHFPSLCGIDLIRIESSTSRELLETIKKEGQLIYERKKK